MDFFIFFLHFMQSYELYCNINQVASNEAVWILFLMRSFLRMHIKQAHYKKTVTFFSIHSPNFYIPLHLKQINLVGGFLSIASVTGVTLGRVKLCDRWRPLMLLLVRGINLPWRLISIQRPAVTLAPVLNTYFLEKYSVRQLTICFLNDTLVSDDRFVTEKLTGSSRGGSILHPCSCFN